MIFESGGTMIRALICCGGGFSSSALMNQLNKDAKLKGIDDKIKFIFCPFTLVKEMRENRIGRSNPMTLIDIEEADDYDIAMLCPHLVHKVKDVEKNFTHPLYVIPPKLYGLMDPVAFLEDAEDAIELWKSGKTDSNWIRFEEEPVPMRVRRLTSHRRWLEAKNNQ